MIPPRSLSSIISLEETHGYTTPNGTLFTLPFQNINCRSTVRIVDFFPPEIADFAVPRARHSEFDVLSEHEANESSDPQSQDQKDEDRRWEWRFALVLEDAKGSRSEKKARLRAYVADQDAVFLLKLDAEEYVIIFCASFLLLHILYPIALDPRVNLIRPVIYKKPYDTNFLDPFAPLSASALHLKHSPPSAKSFFYYGATWKSSSLKQKPPAS